MDVSQRVRRRLEPGVEWRPRHDSHYVVTRLLVSMRGVPPLCVQQGVLREVEAHLRASGPAPAYGLLTGSLCHCPRRRVSYVLVSGAIACPALRLDDEPYVAMATELHGSTGEAARQQLLAVGYYRGATTMVPRPLPEDVSLLHALFPHPWQAMLVRDDRLRGGTGAFVRIEPIHDHPYAAPFVELLPRAGWRKSEGRGTSVVGWTNYHPDAPVTVLPVEATPVTARHGVVSEAPRTRSRLRQILFGAAEDRRSTAATRDVGPAGASAAAPSVTPFERAPGPAFSEPAPAASYDPAPPMTAGVPDRPVLVRRQAPADATPEPAPADATPQPAAGVTPDPDPFTPDGVTTAATTAASTPPDDRWRSRRNAASTAALSSEQGALPMILLPEPSGERVETPATGRLAGVGLLLLVLLLVGLALASGVS